VPLELETGKWFKKVAVAASDGEYAFYAILRVSLNIMMSFLLLRLAYVFSKKNARRQTIVLFCLLAFFIIIIV